MKKPFHNIFLINHHCDGFLHNIYTANIFNDILIVVQPGSEAFFIFLSAALFASRSCISQLFIIDASVSIFCNSPAFFSRARIFIVQIKNMIFYKREKNVCKSI